MLVRFATIVGVMFSLNACGGGGGPGGVYPFTGFSNVNDNGTTLIDGQAVTAEYSADQTSGVVDITNTSGPSASTMRITNENGELVAFSVSSPESTVSFDTKDGDIVSYEVGVVAFKSADGQNNAIAVNPADAGYEYQTYGSWVTGYGTGSGMIGAGSFGSRTPASNIPVGTTATYSGAGIGAARLADGQPYATSSSVIVSTDFNTANIASTGTQAVNLDTGNTQAAAELDFIGSGQIIGSGFVANVSGSGTSGAAQGQFYGPQANEVGGTFTTMGAGGVMHNGAFGAN